MRMKPIAVLTALIPIFAGLTLGTSALIRPTTPPPPSQASPSPAVKKKIEAVINGLLLPPKAKKVTLMKLDDRMHFYKIPGVSIAVINDGKIEWALGFGVKEAGLGDLTSEPVTADTFFEAGSISKPVAAMAALRLVQEGLIDLHANVNDKLRTWKVPDNQFTQTNKVTLGELLRHTAGMTVHGFPGYPAGSQIPTLVEVLNGAKPANTAPVRVETVPGTVWKYSGGGYTVMQQLLIDVMSNRQGVASLEVPFPKILQEKVIGPIKMEHSTYIQPLPQNWQSGAATGHDAGKPIKGKYHTYPEMAAAGLWTTPSDLAIYAIELQKSLAGTSNRVLSQATTKEMLTPGLGSWGLGLNITGQGESTRFGHDGVDYGFEALLVAYETTGQGAVIMTNGTNGVSLCNEIMRGIANVYQWPGYPYPKPIPTPRPQSSE